MYRNSQYSARYALTIFGGSFVLQAKQEEGNCSISPVASKDGVGQYLAIGARPSCDDIRRIIEIFQLWHDIV